ncbi:hypothetical protein PG995_007714 [Apiospora arundinis]
MSHEIDPQVQAAARANMADHRAFWEKKIAAEMDPVARPASGVLSGYVTTDDMFICTTPNPRKVNVATGELYICGEDIVNKGGSIRSHKYKVHRQQFPTGGRESQHEKLARPAHQRVTCKRCRSYRSNGHGLIQHYRAHPDTHGNLRTQEEIFGEYEELLHLLRGHDYREYLREEGITDA